MIAHELVTIGLELPESNLPNGGLVIFSVKSFCREELIVTWREKRVSNLSRGRWTQCIGSCDRAGKMATWSRDVTNTNTNKQTEHYGRTLACNLLWTRVKHTRRLTPTVIMASCMIAGPSRLWIEGWFCYQTQLTTAARRFGKIGGRREPIRSIPVLLWKCAVASPLSTV